MKRKIYKSILSQPTGSVTYREGNYLLSAIPALALLVVVCSISYMVMTTLTVFNTAKRIDYEKQIAVKAASLVELEAKLSSIDKNITPVLAALKGFEEVSNVRYITIKPIKSAMRGNEMEL
jgi:hypothetical protein